MVVVSSVEFSLSVTKVTLILDEEFGEEVGRSFSRQWSIVLLILGVKPKDTMVGSEQSKFVGTGDNSAHSERCTSSRNRCRLDWIMFLTLD